MVSLIRLVFYVLSRNAILYGDDWYKSSNWSNKIDFEKEIKSALAGCLGQFDGVGNNNTLYSRDTLDRELFRTYYATVSFLIYYIYNKSKLDFELYNSNILLQQRNQLILADLIMKSPFINRVRFINEIDNVEEKQSVTGEFTLYNFLEVLYSKENLTKHFIGLLSNIMFLFKLSGTFLGFTTKYLVNLFVTK